MNNKSQQTLDYADSIGFLVDRCLEEDDIIGSGFLLEPERLVTLATLVLPFGAGLGGLKVVFPRLKKERWVESAFFHPHFNRRFSQTTAERTIVKGPDLKFRKHNCVILTLTEEVKPISPEIIAKINDTYSANRASWDKGLSGSLQEIELAIVVQTISSAKKTGQLVVSDKRNRPAAKLFFHEGKIFHAQYRHLRREYAINQLIATRMHGFFEFRPSPEVGWPAASPIGRGTDMLLLEAYRRLDELDKLRAAVGGPRAQVIRTGELLNKSALSETMHEQAGHIWRLLDGLTPNERLWELVWLDEYDLYQILEALAKSGQISLVAVDENKFSANAEMTIKLTSRLRPMPISTEAEISLDTDITCLTINPKNAFVNPRDGRIIGTIDDTDPWHLIHTAAVFNENIGSPIFKDGRVVGMHCGVLPASQELESSLGLLQQMLWYGSLMECCARSKVEAQSQLFVKMAAASLESAEEVADQLQSLGNGNETVVSPGESKGKNQKHKKEDLKEDLEDQRNRGTSVAGRMAAVSVIGVSVLALAAAAFWFNLPQPIFAQADCITVPKKSWLDIGIKQLDDKTNQWNNQPAGKLFHESELISFYVSVFKDCYVYLLYRGSGGHEAALIYPNNLQAEMIKKTGSTFAYPQAEMQQTEKGMLLTGTSFAAPAGDETIIAIASAKPLILGNQPLCDIQKIFDRAQNLLSASSDPSLGAEISKDRLFGSAADVTTSDGTPSETERTVYITGFTARHD